jgi:uncharacterized damage-inducible protein DinB
MNPYASFLDGRDALEIVAATAERLRAAVLALGPERVIRPLAPGKWSVREVLSHLADSEIVFAFRLRQAQAEEHHVVQPMDQDIWARAYRAYDSESALDVFSAVRKWNVRFLSSLPATALDKRLTHPERGEMNFRTLIETMAGHDINHLQQIEGAA